MILKKLPWLWIPPSLPSPVEVASVTSEAMGYDVCCIKLCWTEIEKGIIIWEVVSNENEIGIQKNKKYVFRIKRNKINGIWNTEYLDDVNTKILNMRLIKLKHK
jgi:hypothetical protein